jgi:hypothetical protein
MPIEEIELYSDARSLPPELVRQLAALVPRVLEVDGRESICVGENGRFLGARIARLDNMAIAKTNGRVACYLIEVNDDDAFRLKAKRPLLAFDADDLEAPADCRLKESAPSPDFWYDVAVIELISTLDRQ